MASTSITGRAACGTAVLPRRVKILAEALHDAEHKWGYDALRLIGRDELPQWIHSSRYQAALYDAKGAHLNPLKLAQGLASTIEAAGGGIYEQSQVLDYQQAGSGYVARTEQGEVRCDVLVLACNAYRPPRPRPGAPPVAGWFLSGSHGTAGRRPRPLAAAAQQLRDRQPVRPRLLPPDPGPPPAVRRRLHLPGRYSRMSPAPPAHTWSVFPQLAGVAIDYAWGGHIDCSIQRTPDVGRADQRYWLQGFSGHGVLPTLAAARAVSDAILGDDDLLTLYQGIDNGHFPAVTCWRHRWRPPPRPGTGCGTASEGQNDAGNLGLRGLPSGPRSSHSRSGLLSCTCQNPCPSNSP